MKPAIVIMNKELRSYFTSPSFYLLGFLFTLFLSARFLPSLKNFEALSMIPAASGGGANIHMSVFMVHLNLVYLVMLFLVPLLTMRLFAEEKKEKTLDLLLTAPISSTEIVLGKFFAAWFVVSLFLLLAILYPLSVGLVAEFDYGPLWGSYLGMLLMMGVNTSIGLFASSLTASSLIAAFIGILMTLGVMLAGSLAGSINHPFWSSLVEQVSMVLHIKDFFEGVIETSGVIFFVTTICLFCFLAQRVVESARWR